VLDNLIYQVREIWTNKLQESCSSSDSLLEAYCRQVEACTQIALKCLDKQSQKRPNIVKITKKLNEIEIGVDKVINIICKGIYTGYLCQGHSLTICPMM